ncbi:hypothetical protein PFISCL1PPCAC_5430, partial [Pristionchus fissidentatus]
SEWMDRMRVFSFGRIYIEGEILIAIKVLIKTLSAFVLFLHRKWHRCRTMILLLAISLLTMSFRMMAIHKEVTTCSIRPRVKSTSIDYLSLSSIVYYLSVEMLRAVSLLFVAELTPSVLRMSMVTLVIFTFVSTLKKASHESPQDTFKTSIVCTVVLFVLILMLKRRVTDVPEIFCIYLNDLVPKAKDKKNDEDEDDDEIDKRDGELDK